MAKYAMNNNILSPSSIILYTQCPHAFYLRYFEKYQPYYVNDAPLKIGKSGHAILQHFYENIELSSQDIEQEFMEKMKMTAFKFWDRSVDAQKREEVEPAFFEWLKYEVQRFQNYKKQGCLDRFKPIATEEQITDYQSKLTAIIDKRCIGISGINYCMDYKFDKRLPAQRNFNGSLKEIDLKYKIQSALNTIVLKANNISIGNFFFQFIRYPDRLLSIPLTQSLFDEVNQLIATIRNDTTFQKNPKSCFWCNFKMYCKLEDRSIHCL